MKFTLFIIITCFIYCAHCVNKTQHPKPMNNQQIAEFYSTVMSLIKIAQTELHSLDYLSYFDEALNHETAYILTRIRAYAYNETQADEWEYIAVGVFRIYLVRWCMSQARAYYEAFVAVCTQPENPQSLLTQCIRQLSGYFFQEMQDNFVMPDIENPILLHELNRLSLIRVHVLTTNTFPYLRLQFISESRERFIEESISHQTFNNSFGFELIPYSPYENYMNELTILRNAQSDAYIYLIELSLVHTSEVNSLFLKKCVDEKLQDLAKTYVRGIIEIPANFGEVYMDYLVHRILDYAFLRIITTFLFFDFCFLERHPVYNIYSPNNETMLHLMSNINRLDNNIMRILDDVICRMQSLLKANQISYAPAMLTDFLYCHGFLVGYSKTSDIIIVENNHSNITLENETIP